MLWKLMTLVGLVALANGKAHHLQYPQTGNACILADIDMKNTLTRTEGNHTDSVPTYSLDNTTITSGDCRTTRILNLMYHEDDATIQFTFKNNSGTVNMDLTFSFVPFNVWKSGSNSSVTMDTSIPVGHPEKSYMCMSSQLLKFKKVVDNVTYEAVWNMFDSHIQAFGVENNTYSEAEECSKDMTTHTMANATTETTATTPSNGTTQHTNATTEPTTVPSNMTTEPTNATTETTHSTGPTTPKPDAHPKNTFTFNASDHHSKCVRLQAQIEFTIPYPDQPKKSVTVGIPDIKDVDVSGSCNYSDSTGESMNMMTLKWRDNWSFELVFSNGKASEMLGDDDKSSFWWHEATLNYVYEKALFPNISAKYIDKQNSSMTNFSNSQFKADMDGSYICSAKTTTNLGQGVIMDTWDLQYFAFENKTGFSDNKISQCSKDSKTNSVVPIAVGAALAGLVVIVLIAYLIGRRRNRKGYESV